MLRTPAPFPQVGSYALIQIDGRNHLARLQARSAGGDVLISLPLLTDVASGNRTVSIDALIDGTPLSDFEQRELDRLTTDIAAAKRPAAEKKARAETLRNRIIYAPILAEMMNRLRDPARRASRVAA